MRHYLGGVRRLVRILVLVALLCLVLVAAWATGPQGEPLPLGTCAGAKIVAQGAWQDSVSKLPSLILVPGDSLKHGPEGRSGGEWWEVPTLPSILVCGLNRGAIPEGTKAIPVIRLRFGRTS